MFSQGQKPGLFYAIIKDGELAPSRAIQIFLPLTSQESDVTLYVIL
jgi:MOSC domain-containing protein YiiM